MRFLHPGFRYSLGLAMGLGCRALGFGLSAVPLNRGPRESLIYLGFKALGFKGLGFRV